MSDKIDFDALAKKAGYNTVHFLAQFKAAATPLLERGQDIIAAFQDGVQTARAEQDSKTYARPAQPPSSAPAPDEPHA